MNNTEETVVISVNASMTVPPAYSKPTAGMRQITEKVNPLAGTKFLDNRLHRFGAAPSKDNPYNMREVEKIPLLADDAAEVMTTKLMMPAAAGIPASANICTNGLLSART